MLPRGMDPAEAEAQAADLQARGETRSQASIAAYQALTLSFDFAVPRMSVSSREPSNC